MRKLLFVLLLFILPLVSAIQITEVMYNPTGGDTGREWVEIYADAEVDLTGWKFVESGSAHVLSGDLVIPANTYVIIADKPDKFKQDFPSYAGLLIDSTFSLKNSGETLAMKDPAGTFLSQFTYLASASEGKTDCLVSNAWTACEPTPGAANQAVQQTSEPEKEDVDKESILTQNEEDEEPEVINKILIEVTALSEVRKGEEFEVKVKFTNKYAEDKTFEIQSYVFEGKSTKNEGSYTANKQELSLKAGEEKEVTLTNTIKTDVADGTYTLRVRAKVGTKNYDADQEIVVKGAIEKQEVNKTVAEEPKIVGAAVREVDTEDDYEEEEVPESSTEPKTIYLNSSTGNLNKAALIFIIVLTIAVVFLVISLKK